MTRTINPSLAWAPALIVSVLVHAMMIAILQLAAAPDPIPFAEDIRTRIEVTPISVPALRAQATDAKGEAAETAPTSGERLGVRTVPSSRARPVEPIGRSLAAHAPRGAVALTERSEGEVMQASRFVGAWLPASSVAVPAIPLAAAVPQDMVVVEPLSAPVAATAQTGVAVAAAVPAGEMIPSARLWTAAAKTVTAMESSGPAISTVDLPTTTISAVTAPAQALASDPPQGLGIAAALAEFGWLDTVATAGQAVAEIAPTTARAVTADAEAIQLGPSSPADVGGVVAPTSASIAAIATEATLAWSGAVNTVLDEKTLAAIQSFMQPGEVARSASFAGSVRDGIGAALTRFPCSRLQAAFQPETGGLEVRGHVPAPAMQRQVVAMLRQAVGGAIRIGGSLLVLPPPQCSVLDAVEGLGFPQSKDQENDPLEVGKEAQAEIVSFEDGQRLVFSLRAPEFDAHIYVDYYDKDGNVLHALPNQYVEDNRRHANAHFTIGDSGDESASLEMRVDPPFGQDIAVVLGTTRPLYDGVRPLMEDAAGYLSWLHSRIRRLRLEDPAFRGEWVYLFVLTGPRGFFYQP